MKEGRAREKRQERRYKRDQPRKGTIRTSPGLLESFRSREEWHESF
jgi:hypothetical protein